MDKRLFIACSLFAHFYTILFPMSTQCSWAGITSQINHLHPNPCLRVGFWRAQLCASRGWVTLRLGVGGLTAGVCCLHGFSVPMFLFLPPPRCDCRAHILRVWGEVRTFHWLSGLCSDLPLPGQASYWLGGSCSWENEPVLVWLQEDLHRAPSRLL